MPHGTQPNYVGGTFRARNDDGPSDFAPPVGATWRAPRGTNWGQLVDLNFRIRMLVFSINSTSDTLRNLHLGASYNGGAYFTVNNTSSVLKLSDTIHWNNFDRTGDWAGRLGNRRLYPGPPAALVDGDAVGAVDFHIFQIQDSSHNLFELEFEAEFCLQVVSGDVSDGDTIDIRIFKNTLIPFVKGYTVTARTTVASVPVITTTISTVAAVAPVGLDLAETIAATGGVVVWSLTAAPENATIDSATGLISWTPPQSALDERVAFTAKATTLVGEDTLSWEVLVTGPQMTALARPAEPVLTATTEAVPVLKAKTEATVP